MKTFLNVLYRRILYKIPLKLLLVILAVVALFFAYTNAETIIPNSGFESFQYDISQDGYLYLGYKAYSITNTNNIEYSIDTQYDMACIRNFGGGNCQWSIDNSTWYNVASQSLNCFGKGQNFRLRNCSNVSAFFYKVGEGLLPKLTSLQCQTEYNLIPISSVDQNYCTTNNLCPSYNCPVNSGGTISNVYINDILHVGAPFIYMNIPEEINWDYAYTAGGQNMNIDIAGYNVDYEKMQSIIDQQNYKPSQEDFSNIISILGPYSQIILFFVFLFIVWAWIKKPFKSKL